MAHNYEKNIEAIHNNLLQDGGHMTLDLNLCSVRRVFDCQNPVLMSHIEGNVSAVSGIENSVDLVEIMPGKGFKTLQNLSTDGLEVQAACLIDGGNHGISMTPMFVDEEKTHDILILGCDRGSLYKYTRPVNDKTAKWEQTGQMKVDQRVYDVL